MAQNSSVAPGTAAPIKACCPEGERDANTCFTKGHIVNPNLQSEIQASFLKAREMLAKYEIPDAATMPSSRVFITMQALCQQLALDTGKPVTNPLQAYVDALETYQKTTGGTPAATARSGLTALRR